MADVFKVADVVVNEWVKAHGDKIGIIAYYGSYAKGTASDKSDLDLFYIPDGPSMWRWDSWVIDDVPFEIWAISWPFAEEIVTGVSRWPVGPSIIAHAKVLYSRSPEDLARFEALRAKIDVLEKPESKKRLLELAMSEYKNLLACLGNLQIAFRAGDTDGVMISGRNLAGAAISCIAYVNQRYMNKSWESSIDEVMAMPKIPSDLSIMLKIVALPSDSADVLSEAADLAFSIRRLIIDEQQAIISEPDVKASMGDFYNVIHEFAIVLEEYYLNFQCRLYSHSS
jgi:predicted nucleotidyltransferase